MKHKPKSKHSEKEEHSEHKTEHKASSHAGSRSSKKNDLKIWQGSTFVLLVLLIISLFTCGFGLGSQSCAKDQEAYLKAGTDLEAGKADTTVIAEPGEKVKLEFYVMSQCPFGTQVEDAIIPVLRKMGDAVDFHLDYIANDNGDGTFASLHGQAEVEGDIVQLCTMKHAPDKFIDFLECQNKDVGNVDTNWEKCATDVGADVDLLKACFEGDEGKKLLTESISKAQARQASGSPTIYVADEAYKSGRDSLSFQRALCAHVDHPECADLPACGSDADCTAEADKIGVCENANTKDAECIYKADAKVTLTIVNDKECDSCDTSQVVQVTKQLFPNVEFKELDYGEAEGKALMENTGVSMLPLYVFSDTVKEAARYDQVAQVLVESDGGYYIHPEAVGANYDPTIEAVPKNLKLFVMSQCPYGSMAVKNMEEVLDAVGDQIDFELYFIANDNGDGTFTSLHGQTEVDEDIRQVCVMKHYPDTYFDYVLCQAQDISGVAANWEKCAADNGMEASVISTCAEGDEGKELFKENIKLANARGIGGSPTFIVNNKNVLGGAQPADAIKSAVCDANSGMSGCDQTLTTTSDAPAGGGCGA